MKFNAYSIFSIAILIFYAILFGYCSSFNEKRTQVEDLVKSISDKMTDLYEEWENGCSCPKKSYNACIGIKKKECNYQFPKISMCLSDGEYVSPSSSIKFPINLDYNNLSEEDIKFVCTSAQLEVTFKEIEKKRSKNFTAMYFGSNRGLFRRYPGEFRGRQEKCNEYDPRMRPWYTIAASGSKNVLILIDKSSSMRKRADDVKIAASTMIDTLSISDNFGILTFSDEVWVLGEKNESLIQALSSTKAAFKKIVSEISYSFDEETNYVNVFNRSLELFNETLSRGDFGCSEAENVILLITDGNPTLGNKSSQFLISMVNNFTKSKESRLKRLVLFVYALGKINNTEYLRDLTCEFKGTVLISEEGSKLTSASESATKLQNFYDYLSIGVTFTRPIWTEPYIDYYTGLELVTASMPAYYTNKTTNLRTLIGVAGIDVILQEFSKNGDNKSDVVEKLIGESACQKNQMDECKLKALRSLDYQCETDVCISAVNYETPKVCLNHISSSEIYTMEDSVRDANRCCGLQKDVFIVFIGVCVGLIMFGVLLVWKRKSVKLLFCDQKYRYISSGKPRKILKDNKLVVENIEGDPKDVLIAEDDIIDEDEEIEDDGNSSVFKNEATAT